MPTPAKNAKTTPARRPAPRKPIPKTRKATSKAGKQSSAASDQGPALNDPAALARLAKIETDYAALAASDNRDRFRMGVTIGPVRFERLYLSRNFKTFAEYCKKVLHIERSLAIALTDEAKAYSEAQFLRLGESHARLGMLLLKATPEADTVADLEGMKLRFGSGKGKGFLDATFRELLEDIAGERGKGHAPHPAPPGVSDDEEIFAIAIFNKLSANGVGGMNVAAKPAKTATRLVFDIQIGDFPNAVKTLAPLIDKLVPASLRPKPS